MKNLIGALIIVLYMFSNGFLSVFRMYKDTNENEIAKEYNNKIVRFLAKISGYVIIILIMMILNIYGLKIGIIVFLAGFLGQRFFNIIVHFLIVIPINNIIYKN